MDQIGELLTAITIDPVSPNLETGTYGKLWLAERGNGVYVDGKQISRCNKQIEFEKAFGAFQVIWSKDVEGTEELFDGLYKKLWHKRHSYTTHLAQALAYANVIAGHMDFAVANHGARPWDVAFALLAAELIEGLDCSDLRGEIPHPLERPYGFVVGQENLVKEVVELAKEVIPHDAKIDNAGFVLY